VLKKRHPEAALHDVIAAAQIRSEDRYPRKICTAP